MSVRLVFNLISLLFVLLLTTNCYSSRLYIRANQVGYLPRDTKQGIVLSDDNLSGVGFSIKNERTGDTEFTGELIPFNNGFGNFRYSYQFEFSRLIKRGNFKIVVNNQESFPFEIGFSVYNQVVDTLMEFYKIQRCGYTNPEYHEVCHIADATSIIINGKKIDEKYDVTGGWHDAADYIKFLNTTAYTTYILLFSYEFDKDKFAFDNDSNGVPDVLDEAKIGLDWLIRANYNDTLFITQVQDLRDHDVGWRKPENDPLGFDRPAFTGIGKNLIGIYSATLSLASRIWKEKFQLNDFANRCLRIAEQKFLIMDSVPDIDSSGTGHYVDSDFSGKVALGAAELYLTTKDNKYLSISQRYADKAGADYWWSWGNVNSLAHYRLAKIFPRFSGYLKRSLTHFSEKAKTKLFGEGADSYWGSNNATLGINLINILYRKITYDDLFNKMAESQKDYILGKNQWGISFIYGIGERYCENLHHQLSPLMNGYLPGGFAAGPVFKEYLDSQNIEFEKRDKYSLFQTDSAYYRDDRMDYISNEPTIVANATAIFVFGNLMSRR